MGEGEVRVERVKLSSKGRSGENLEGQGEEEAVENWGDTKEMV